MRHDPVPAWGHVDDQAVQAYSDGYAAGVEAADSRWRRWAYVWASTAGGLLVALLAVVARWWGAVH